MNALALLLSAAATARAAGNCPFPSDPSLDIAMEYAAAGHVAMAIKLAEQALRNATRAA